MTISNLPILPDDPRGHPFKKKLKSLEQPTVQQPYKTVSTSHRTVFSQHPHRAARGRITLSPQPPPTLRRRHTSQVIPKAILPP